MKTPLIPFVALGISCCAPKAIIVEEPKPQRSGSASPASRNTTPPPVKSAPNDGLRISEDILALPNDDQLRSNKKSPPDSEAPIIVRPPPSE